MGSTLSIILPIFGLVLIGFTFGRPPFFSAEALKGLNTFIMNFALPALLFRAMATGGLPSRSELAILEAYYFALAAVALLSVASWRFLWREPLDSAAVLSIGSTFSNLVLIGIPIIQAAYGQEGLSQLLLIVSFHAVILIGGATVMAEVGRGAGDSLPRVLARTVVSLVSNSFIIGILAGLVWGTLALPIPKAFDDLLALLGSAAIPCSLFALGAGLIGFRPGDLLGRTLLMIAFKQALLPASVWAAGRFLIDLDPLPLAVAVTAAGMPVGANAFIFAMRYQLHTVRMATAVVVTTIMAVPLSALLITWLNPFD